MKLGISYPTLDAGIHNFLTFKDSLISPIKMLASCVGTCVAAGWKEGTISVLMIAQIGQDYEGPKRGRKAHSIYLLQINPPSPRTPAPPAPVVVRGQRQIKVARE